MGISWAPADFAALRPLSTTLSGLTKRLFWFDFLAMCWTLWTTRNKFTIEKVFPSSVANVIFKLCMFLQQWKSLIKEEDKEAVVALTDHVCATVVS